jgi:ATP-dependent Clp protease ATP-binding subunit ClpC
MFERFTERARQVIVLAQEEARTLWHNYIGTEHLLLGLLREADGWRLGSWPLEVSLEEVRGEVARIVGEGEHESQGQIPFTPRAKKVLNWLCAKLCRSVTTTSAPSTSCSDW